MDDWLPPESRNRHKSPATYDYNCIGWALGDDTRWWWPGDPDALTRAGHHWPSDLPTMPTIETFVALFEMHRYEVCVDGSFEEGYEKVALYALDDGEPSHAARQLPSKVWTSKYGNGTDCEHDNPEDAECRAYGRVVRFFRRPNASATAETSRNGGLVSFV